MYKPPNQNKQYFLHYNNTSLNSVPSLMFCGDFNLATENWNLDTFINCFGLKPCIDLNSTSENFFKNSNVLEVGIFDHHNLVLPLLESRFIKGTPKMKLHMDIQNKFIERFRGSI